MAHGKGQGALEYMTTYGWAVLAVLIAAVVLWQMGMFSAPVSDGWSGFGIIRPVEWSCDTDGDSDIYFNNAAGASISGITAAFDGQTAACSSGKVMTGKLFSCNVTGTLDACKDGRAGDRYKLDVSVNYLSPTGAARSSSGAVWGAIEEE